MSLDNLCMHACIFPAFKNIKNEALNHERTDPPYIEIFFKIFEKLGLQDWCRAKQVCKEWKQVVEKHPLAENIYRLALRHVTQKDGPLQEVVDTKKLAQEVGCIEKLGDIYAEKGTSKALLQAAGLYNYARRLSSADKQEITKEKLLTAHDLLAQLCKGKHLDEALITKEFKSNRLALRSHRRRIKKKIRSLPDTPSPQQVRELYRGIAQRIKSFFSFLVDQAIDVLGPSPCEYAMIGFGSLAREEMTPYSDLEFGILIKEDSDVNKKYFRNLTNLIHLKVINLGETILPALNVPCLKEIGFFDGITPRGFAFDGAGVEGKGCKTPLGNGKFKLIQTPEKMAQYIAQDKDEEWWHEKERHLPMELLTFTHLLGTEELTEQYRQKVQENLNTPYQKGLNLRQYLARQHLVQEDMKVFDPWMLGIEKHGMLIKVKNDLYRFPHLALDRLALLKEIKASDTFTRIDQLNKQEIISDSAAEKLKEWMSIVLFMRLKTYSHYQAQQEMMNPLIKPFGFEDPQLIKNQFALDHEALAKVKKIYRIFIPFHEALQEFLAGREEELRSATLDKVLFQMDGDIALRLLQYEEAKKHYLSAKDAASEDSDILTALGCISLAQGNLDQAAKYIHQALQVDIKDFRENPVRIATDYSNLVDIYVEQGESNEAKKYADKALKIDLEFLPEDHLHIARDYNNLGRICLALRELTQANEYFEKALKIHAHLYGGNHPNVATYYNNLGMIYQDQKELEKAAEYVKKALAIDQSYYGEYHPLTATDYNNLGTIYLGQGNFDEATKYCKKALEINLKFFGVAHPFVAENYDNLGQVYLSRKDFVKAIEYTCNSLEIFCNLYGENHPGVATTYNNLGLIYQEQEDLNQAAMYIEKALKIDLDLFGENSLRVGKRYINLSSIYAAQGRLNEAAKYASDALNIYRDHKEDNEDMAIIAAYLVTLHNKKIGNK